jgi:hypothetical protein
MYDPHNSQTEKTIKILYLLIDEMLRWQSWEAKTTFWLRKLK